MWLFNILDTVIKSSITLLFATVVWGNPNIYLGLPQVRIVPTDGIQENYQVGDTITYEFLWPEGDEELTDLSVNVIESGDDLLKQGWVVVEHPQYQKGKILFVLSPVKSGNLSIPTLIVSNDLLPFAHTTSFRVNVLATGRNMAEPKEYLPPEEIGLPHWVTVSIYSAIFIASILLIWFLVRISKKRISYPKFTKNLDPADLEALKAFRMLEKRDFISRGEYKKHFFRVSEIIKNYMGRRFDIDANESTTSELLDRLKNQKVSHKILDETKSLFDRLDIIKFTNRIPPDGEGLRVVVEAQLIVQATKKSEIQNAI